MTFAYWCVLAAAYMPLLWTALAKSSPSFDNAAPRTYFTALSGWRLRAHWVQLNGFEAFPSFAAAVIIASLVHAPQARLDQLAAAFIVLRVLYGVAYLANRATLRTVIWSGATACVVGLFVLAAHPY